VQAEAADASAAGIGGVPFFCAYRQGAEQDPLTFSGAHPPKTLLKVRPFLRA
jgi:predicted DsbA family dithiol-disulfide isomerase